MARENATLAKASDLQDGDTILLIIHTSGVVAYPPKAPVWNVHYDEVNVVVTATAGHYREGDPRSLLINAEAVVVLAR